MVKHMFTSESVTEGHPDKVADQISDAVLDGVFAEDPNGRVACETLVTTGLVVVAGEISTNAYVDIAATARATLNRIGYNDGSLGIDGNTCGVIVSLDEQSPDIAQGVNHALESRKEDGASGDDLDSLGAGDQGMMFGFACDETDSLLPLPIWTAHQLARRLATVRKESLVPGLRPDGKTQVTFEYENGRPVRLDTVLLSTQHDPGVDQNTLHELVTEYVIQQAVPEQYRGDDFRVLVNPTGTFVLGGPQADVGLTGRKIIVDTYGGSARHGGGCFSGKDPSKVDRSAAYASRWVAKHVVASGVASRCEVQVAYAIGVAHPVSIMVETFGTETIDPNRIQKAIHEVFDLRPAAIVRDLKLRQPIYSPTAAYGHFGRDEETFTWEQTTLLPEFTQALA